MSRNEADVVRSARPLGEKMSTFDIIWPENKVMFMYIVINFTIKLISLKNNESAGSIYE